MFLLIEVIIDPNYNFGISHCLRFLPHPETSLKQFQCLHLAAAHVTGVTNLPLPFLVRNQFRDLQR